MRYRLTSHRTSRGIVDTQTEPLSAGFSRTRGDMQRRSDKWRPTSRIAEADRKLGEAAEHQPVAVGPAQLAAVNSKRKIGEAAEQRAEGDLRLEPSEGCT
jgi:hypothetical protein